MAEYNFPAVVPSIVVSDVKATLDWFHKLGFQTQDEMAGPDGSIVHAEVRRGDVVLMMGPGMNGAAPGSTGMSLYINLGSESVDGYHDRVRAAGVAITDPLTDQFWGDRTFMVEHPDGYRIMFSQHVRDVSAAEMAQAMEQMAGAGAPA
jgi:PhnB protein